MGDARVTAYLTVSLHGAHGRGTLEGSVAGVSGQLGRTGPASTRGRPSGRGATAPSCVGGPAATSVAMET